MSQEGDRILYVRLFNLYYDACRCNDNIKEIETRYDKDTLRKWVEEVGK